MLNDVARALRRIESGLLVALLLAMIGVAVYQVVARNLFGTGLTWGDGMVRVALLWVTMIGAMAAGPDGHIRVDVIGRFAGERVARRLGRITNLFAAALCLALGWYSLTLIYYDYVDGTPGFGVVPAWVCELVIPVASSIMGVRYLIASVRPQVLQTGASETQP